MTDQRKTIRVTIPAELVSSFDHAKALAEQAGMMRMTDTQYASRVLAWAIEQTKERGL
jgi:hypothetical protein